MGQVAAQKSMELIEAKIRSLNPDNQPTVLTADFNKMLDSPIFHGVKQFMADARTTAPVTDNKASFNNFGEMCIRDRPYAAGPNGRCA